MSAPEERKEMGEEVIEEKVEETSAEVTEAESSEGGSSEGESSEGTSSEGESSEGNATEKVLPENEELNLGQERVVEFVSYVVVNLVDHPEDVTVDVVRRQGRDVYQVRVHNEDLGKVIGKGGQTARALRVMLTALSARTDQRIGLEIVE